MRARLAPTLTAAFAAGLAACTTTTADPTAPPAPGNPPAQAGAIRLTPAHARAVGQKVWQNECGGTVDGLTSWNKGEYFASLGIGHFIWYPAGKEGPFEESFPPLVAFLRARGTEVPGWVAATPDCPWADRESFMADFRSPRMDTLRAFLKNTIAGQTEFLVRRAERALPKMLAAVPPAERDRVQNQFYAVAESPQGVYALIDYTNFKGEGTNPNERYKGQGWGLLQVLQEMRGAPRGAAAAAEFSEAAKRVLRRRVANAPRAESQWLAGWMNRCASYAQPFGR